MLVWIVLAFIFSFLMAFSIGANDASNGLATSYGSKALSLKWLIVLGAIAEFVGAMYCSDVVSSTLGHDIINELSTFKNEEQQVMMFTVCLSSFLFIMTSSISGMPISGTHTVVGAFLGTGIYAQGFKRLNWAKMG